MRVVPMHEVTEVGVAAVAAEALATVGEGPTYLSFDIDSVDPAYAPGTGTPEVGGLTSVECPYAAARAEGRTARRSGRRRGRTALRPFRRHGPAGGYGDVRAALPHGGAFLDTWCGEE